MKTASVHILYDPLVLTFDVTLLGGNLSQRLDAASQAYEPDRTLAPLRLSPVLHLQDPNHILPDGDHSADLIDCRWYLGTDDRGTPLHLGGPQQGFQVSAHGLLTVTQNAFPGEAIPLFLTCAYIDPRTGKVFPFHWSGTLTCDLSRDWNLSVRLNVPRKYTISPYRRQTERVIEAICWNGSTQLNPLHFHTTWQVFDPTIHAYRDIDPSTDLWYKEGADSFILRIDPRYIENILLQVTCHPSIDPTATCSTHFKAHRWYGQWEEAEVITQGKYLRPDTPEVAVQCILNTPRGELTNPQDYFDITHLMMRREAGSRQTVVGYGPTVIMPASQLPRDPHVEVVFGCQVHERTALHAATIGGRTVTIGGKILTLSTIKQ